MIAHFNRYKFFHFYFIRVLCNVIMYIKVCAKPDIKILNNLKYLLHLSLETTDFVGKNPSSRSIVGKVKVSWLCYNCL